MSALFMKPNKLNLPVKNLPTPSKACTISPRNLPNVAMMVAKRS